MDDRRRAELLIVRLRWLALLAGAYMHGLPLTPPAVLVIFTVFIFNAIASQIVTDKSLFARYGNIAALFTRCLDMAAITLAARYGGPDCKDLHLLYLFVIVGTGYAYNGLFSTVIALFASMGLDSILIFNRIAATDLAAGVFTQHSAIYLTSALITSYIIAFRRQDESMRMKERKLSALFECGTRLTSAKDLNQLLNHLLDVAIMEMGAVGGSIMFVDANHQLVSEVVRGADRNPDEPGPDCEIAKDVLSTGQPILLNPGSVEETHSLQDSLRGPIICVPLVDRNSDDTQAIQNPTTKIIGTLSIYSDQHDLAFGTEDLELLRTLGLHASMGIVNARLYNELHDTFVRTLQSLARSLEARDPYTQGHSYRVSEIAQLAAAKLGLSSNAIEVLRNAALLHDIGKIGVPDIVLQKPGRLTPEERLIIQTHSATGENICRPLGLSEDILFLIRHHQERLNGSGYPDQLPAEHQPLPLRILCAVDALDAMSSDRPYRKACLLYTSPSPRDRS